jgi:hypothetical protein
VPRDKAKVPASIETEQALLAAILLGSSADSPASVADEAMPIIEPSLFYDDKHRVILKAIRAVWARGYGVDSRMVFDELNSMGKAGEVGGATYLTTICGPIAGAGSMANWKGYLHILQEQARRRRYDELLLMARAHNIEGQDAQRDRALAELEAVRAEAAAMAEGREALRYEAESAAFADFDPEEVRWLWKPYIPSRKVTILAGPAGVGKTFLQLAIATAVSSGKSLPNQDGTMSIPPQGSVIILSDEDDIADTLRPRLDKMGANVHNIFSCRAKLDIRTRKRQAISLLDVDVLKKLIREKSAKLVIVDHVHGFIGGNVDVNSVTAVRPILRDIGDLAKECDCAFILVMHPSKGVKDTALERLHGSIAFGATVRSVIMLGQDKNDPNIKTAVQIKLNVEQRGRAFRFTVNNGVFEWAGMSDATATEILEPDAVRDERRTKVQEAREWLVERLGDGGRYNGKELQQEAENAGIARMTLRRAAQEAGVVIERELGAGGKWYWSLPK